MSLKICKGEKTLEFKTFNFPGGEVGFKLHATDYAYQAIKATNTIIAHIRSSNDLIELAMAKDALERYDENPIQLVLSYVPYARQDRVCVPGESFSLQFFARFLNFLNFQKVIICDPHSTVTPALINNVKVFSQFDIVNKWPEFIKRIMQGGKFVSPDAGANKKTSDLAALFSHSDFVRADKLRDLGTGAIKETVVYADDLQGQTIFIADDICDGGRTFIELAKVLKAKNAGKVVLFVTHGIFSQGFEPLFNGGIDEIWTTNSFKDLAPDIPGRVHVLNIEKVVGHLI